MPAQSSTPVADNYEEDSTATPTVIATKVPIASFENTLGGPNVADIAGLVEESKDEQDETAVASPMESSSSYPTGSDGGYKWKGIHVGVWLAIGACVAVGAALWSRRR
ncbi:unnamed protein product [Ectocarpus sp. 12 AP-2014]